MAQSDVLILLDCCWSGVANETEGSGVTELLCACPFDGRANGVGHYSFTQALTTELRLLSKLPSFSTGRLYTAIYTRMQSFLVQGLDNERYPPPVHFVLSQDGSFARGIHLSVLRPKPTTSPKGDKSATLKRTSDIAFPTDRNKRAKLCGAEALCIGETLQDCSNENNYEDSFRQSDNKNMSLNSEHDSNGSLRRHFFLFASNAASQYRRSAQALLTLASPSTQVIQSRSRSSF